MRGSYRHLHMDLAGHNENLFSVARVGQAGPDTLPNVVWSFFL